jgi:hypothetical protein
MGGMARQKLGPKKHARCEQIGGRPYFACLTRGGQEHYTAICTFYDAEDTKHLHQHCDRIDYKNGIVIEHWGPGLDDPVKGPRA